MAIRKRCKHAYGLTGQGKMRAWRQCGCVWGTDIYVDGVRCWKNLGRDEHAAKIADAQLRLDVMQGKRPTRGAGHGFATLADEWLVEKEAAIDARPGSVSVWRTRVNHAKRFLGDIPVSDLRQHHVNSLVEAFTREIGAPTAANVAVTVSAIIKWAAARHGIDPPQVTFRGVVQHSRRHGEQSHTVAELKAVIALLAEPYQSLGWFALLTGMRRGELLALTVDDVEPNGIRVHGNLDVSGQIGPTKTRAGKRLVTLSPHALEVVKARAKAVGAGRLWPVTLHAAGDALRDAMRAAGVYKQGKGWHQFRHAHMALLNESNISIRDAAARVGHGANYAQSLAYGWASEQVDATAVDAAVKRHEKKKRAGHE